MKHYSLVCLLVFVSMMAANTGRSAEGELKMAGTLFADAKRMPNVEIYFVKADDPKAATTLQARTKVNEVFKTYKDYSDRLTQLQKIISEQKRKIRADKTLDSAEVKKRCGAAEKMTEERASGLNESDLQKAVKNSIKDFDTAFMQLVRGCKTGGWLSTTTNSNGDYSIALPGDGRYLALVSASCKGRNGKLYYYFLDADFDANTKSFVINKTEFIVE